MTDGVRVVAWTTRESDHPVFANLTGGWFGFPNGDEVPRHRWRDYLDAFVEEVHPRMEALRAEILRRNLKECGPWHQSEKEEGTPVFSDGTVMYFTFRAWGDLLAAVWSEEEDEQYSYMYFYM